MNLRSQRNARGVKKGGENVKRGGRRLIRERRIRHGANAGTFRRCSDSRSPCSGGGSSEPALTPIKHPSPQIDRDAGQGAHQHGHNSKCSEYGQVHHKVVHRSSPGAGVSAFPMSSLSASRCVICRRKPTGHSSGIECSSKTTPLTSSARPARAELVVGEAVIHVYGRL